MPGDAFGTHTGQRPSRSGFCLQAKYLGSAGRPQRSIRRMRQRQDKGLCIIELCSMSMVNENDQANRAISNGKLHALLHFHTRPINVVVFHGSDREYSFSGGFPA